MSKNVGLLVVSVVRGTGALASGVIGRCSGSLGVGAGHSRHDLVHGVVDELLAEFGQFVGLGVVEG